MTRNPLSHGLTLTLRHLPAFLWTFAFNLFIPLLFSISFHARLASILNHSLYSQRIASAFDLGPVIDVFTKMNEGGGSGTLSASFSVAIYTAIYFLLVPGTLLCYQTGSPVRLGTLLQQGLLFFWRFIRITILAVLVCGVLLGPLFALQHVWTGYLDEHILGRPGFILRHVSLALILLAASLLRLYFDLVEVHTVQLSRQLGTTRFGSTPRSDRRVRRTLRPAWQTLRLHLFRNWLSFVLLSLLGLAAVVLAGRFSIHSLAQTRTWPAFVVTQIGLFVMLFTRFWQRGLETILAEDNPLPVAAPLQPPPPFRPAPPPEPDPIPNPEPAAPSLSQPDPGVFHHDVSQTPR